MKSKLLVTITVALSLFVLTTDSVYGQGIYASKSVGEDVSWPNCSLKIKKSMPFGIVGVTDGLGYSTSPCLANEASHFSDLSLYVNTGWDSSSSHVNPSSPHVCAAGDSNCLAYNYGYNAGLYAFNAASIQGVSSSTWWLDVENDNTWSTDMVQNQNSLQGEHDALISEGVITVGIYSTTDQWQTITGGWQNELPGWGATTVKTAKEASKYCTGHEFTGGSTWLIQFKDSPDKDYAC